MNSAKPGEKNQPENISIEDQAHYDALESFIRMNFPTFAEVDARKGEYMRPFSVEKIEIHKKVKIALKLMELHSLYRVAGVESIKEWIATRPYATPSDEVKTFLREAVDDIRLVRVAWHMAVKRAGNNRPTMRQLKWAAKEVNRLGPKWLEEGKDCLKAFEEGIANGEVIVNVHLIE